jgi:pSer/pThr/pTyr-binding forkhead associated (FHA) protein
MIEVTLTIDAPQETRTIPLLEGRLTVGRGHSVDVHIDDDDLSRLHATLYRENDKVWIVDEASTNGSRVNGRRVGGDGAPLADKDKINIGETIILVSVSDKNSRKSDDQPRSSFKLPMAALPVVIVALLIGVLAVKSFVSESRSPQRAVIEERYEFAQDIPPKLDAASNSNAAPNPTAATEPPSVSRKLYLQMSQEERLEFIYDRARHISRMMGNREYQFTDDVLPYIKQYVEGYARRVGNGSSRIWGEDLDSLFSRARLLSPYIIRSFNSQGVPAVVGLYIPMIESEYRPCLTSPVGAKGLFQFMPETARGYGVAPDDRCDVQKMAPAAAKYMKDRITEFGSDSMSVALGIAGYNRSPDSVRRDLQDVLDSQNKERSFWTLVANSDKLDRYFQNENIKYVPKFFAAAIVGETPSAFGLRMNPLSTCTQTDDAP